MIKIIDRFLFWYSMPFILIVISPIILISVFFIAKRNKINDPISYLEKMKPVILDLGSHISEYSWFIAIVQTIIIYQLWLK